MNGKLLRVLLSLLLVEHALTSEILRNEPLMNSRDVGLNMKTPLLKIETEISYADGFESSNNHDSFFMMPDVYSNRPITQQDSITSVSSGTMQVNDVNELDGSASALLGNAQTVVLKPGKCSEFIIGGCKRCTDDSECPGKQKCCLVNNRRKRKRRFILPSSISNVFHIKRGSSCCSAVFGT